jgi:hypothetical protein
MLNRELRRVEAGSWCGMLVVGVLVCVVAVFCGQAQGAPGKKESLKGLTVRVKVVSVEPEQPVYLVMQWGGRGLGGDVSTVPMQLMEPAQAKMMAGPVAGGGGGGKDDFEIPHELGADPAASQTVKDASGKVYLKPGVWSRANPMTMFTKGFLECFVDGKDKPVKKMKLAFEFSFDGKVLRTFEEKADAGNRVTMVVGRGDPAAPGWGETTMGISEYAEKRAQALEALPWAGFAIPKLVTVLTDCGGYGNRHTNTDILKAEARVLSQLGVNSLRAGWDIMPAYMKEIPASKDRFGRAVEAHSGGNPIISINIDRKTGKVTSVPPGGGCPWTPDMPERAKAVAVESIKKLSEYPVQEVWGLTIDEIGSVFNSAAEGKAHMSTCPDCQKAFKEWLKGKGFKPSDFDCASWDEVKNIYAPNARPWAEVDAEEKRIAREKLEALPGVKAGDAGMVSLKKGEDVTPVAPKENKEAKESKGKAGAGGKGGAAAGAGKAVAGTEVDLEDKEAEKAVDAVAEKTTAEPMTAGKKRLLYWSNQFNNYTTGHTFAALRKTAEEQNKARQAALDKGDTNSEAAKKPFIYTFALRGNTFLMGDASLDFFDFYREADNAMVYETSNRDARVWQWDSYLCDVGRSLQVNMGKKFGVYVKPHRGAPVQRMLAAVSRGATLVFLYTYGPDYSKGDSFSSSEYHLANTSKAVHLAGKAEELIVGAKFYKAPEVAVVRNSTPNSAEWEDGKWVYAALQHSHVPVDALDQVMLTTNDLSKYKVIYVTGGLVFRDAALALKKYVEQGGVLYTGAGGLAYDEAGEPIKEMEELLGVQGRTPAVLWCGGIRRYGATGLGTFGALGKAPEGFEGVDGAGEGISPVVGYEPIKPRPGAKVVAKFGNGSPALIVNEVGKGKVYLSALYGGLEYAAKVHRGDFDMNADFEAGKRAWVTAPIAGRVTVPMEVSAPLVEAVTLIQEKTGKRSISLMNWAYGPDKRIVPQENVKVTIADGKGITKVLSSWSGEPLKLEKKGDAVVVTIPKLEEGDVLAIE